MADALTAATGIQGGELRIIHVIDKAFPPSADDGGAPQYVAELLDAQHRMGCHAWVATTNHVAGGSALQIRPDSSKARQLLELTTRKSADVVHFHSHAEQIQDALFDAGVPSVCHVHGDHFGIVSASRNRIYVSASHAKRHDAQAYVYNGSNLAGQPYVAYPSDYFVFLGKVRRSKKGADVAVDVAKQTRRELRIIGGRKLSIPETWLPLNHNIRALGVLAGSRKREVLSHARALLFPVKWDEPFGLVLIEAMACGVPVIAFNRGAVPEIVKDGETGFVVDDFDGMCAAVERIDEIDRAACRQHVADNFSIERTAKGVEKYYRRAMAGEVW